MRVYSKGTVILLALLLAGGGAMWYLRASYRQGILQRTVLNQIVGQVTQNPLERDTVSLLLGFDRPRTYLILFLNNTEIRPGGGFIGAYAVVTLDKGIPHIRKLEGTEIIDGAASPEALPAPPAPLSNYLKVERWYFRDSNWSPDFARSSAYALELYRKQHGFAADQIDGVIGFTPTVIEKILKLMGPVSVAGQTFASNTITERLEYEVEYGYAQRGITFDDRKKFLADLGGVILQQLKSTVWRQWGDYFALATALFKEKQLLLYAVDPSVQQILTARGWTGEMKPSVGDYLLWVDANLGALKTDAAIKRSLTYQLTPTSSGFIAQARMVFKHQGHFDWRTSRYRDYVRVYVPKDSTFLTVKGSMKIDKSREPGMVNEGVEEGRRWFGTFISIEPGKSAELVFEYFVDPAVVTAIRAGSYHLLVQKQIGSLATPLTLGLKFDTKVVAAAPGEASERHGDGRYDLQTDLREDRQFSVTLQK